MLSSSSRHGNKTSEPRRPLLVRVPETWTASRWNGAAALHSVAIFGSEGERGGLRPRWSTGLGQQATRMVNPPPTIHIGGGVGVTQDAPVTSNRTYRMSIHYVLWPCHPEKQKHNVRTYVRTHACSSLYIIPQTNKGR
ncbi:unnamed protein product [Ectocarpus sp. 12 AP-2014]